MRIPTFLFSLVFLFSCSGAGDRDDCTTCESVAGKTWYWQDKADEKCLYFEHFTLKENGTVSVKREGLDINGKGVKTEFPNACRWALNGCILTFSDPTPEYLNDTSAVCRKLIGLGNPQDFSFFLTVCPDEPGEVEKWTIRPHDCENAEFSGVLLATSPF